MNLKRMAAEAAVSRVRDGMVLGLGTGSTTRFAVERLGSMVAEGINVTGVPTSDATAELAKSLGIPLTNLDDHPELDLTIDGADEVDPGLNLIKGMGGALFREKLVALASKEMVVIVDESKLVETLGQRTPVPVEVLPFGWKHTFQRLANLGCEPSLRGTPSRRYVTDNGNYILDCSFQPIENASALERRIKHVPGVLECGLFVGIADLVLVGQEDGIREMRRP